MKTKTNNIIEDYQILDQVLGTGNLNPKLFNFKNYFFNIFILGISGKVLCCINKNTNIKYALKVI